MDEVVRPEGASSEAAAGAVPEAADEGVTAVDDTSSGDGIGSPSRRPGRRTRARARLLWRKVTRRSFVVLSLLLVAIVAGLSQTSEGHELVLNAALDRISDALDGELFVGGIRSGTLLTGATLTDVRLDAADGRRFLEADSVVLRYSLPSILVGGPPVRATTFWGLDLEVSRFSADDVLNVTRLLAESEPDSTSGAPGRPVDLGRIGVRNGSVRLLTPARPGSAAPTVEGPDGRLLQQLAFQDLDLDLENAFLRPRGAIAFEAGLASLSASVFIQDEPLVLREVFGRVTFGAQGIRVQDAAFRLPSTLFRGQLTVGPARPADPWTVRSDLEVDGWGDLADLSWVDPRIPDGRFRGRARIEVPSAVEVDFDRFEVELEASNVLASGWVRFDEALTLRGMRITTSPLAVERLEPWLAVDFPFDGWLSGQATFSGSLVDLNATGRVTLVPTGYDGGITTADFNGTVHMGDDPGASDLEVRLQPLNYSVLESFWAGMPLSGSGDALLELDGRAEEGITIAADFGHSVDSASTSRALVRGVARRLDDGEWITDLRGELLPLSLRAFSEAAPSLGLMGDVAGPITLSGRLDNLSVTADLVAGGGGVLIDGTTNLRSPGSGYRLEAEVSDLPLAAFVSELPERSAWTGRFVLEGRGLALDSLEARATLVASDSRIGLVQVDTVAAAFRVQRGVLITDTLDANVAGIDVNGRGRFGLVEGAWGSSRLSFEAESLVGLRPLTMGLGDTILVRDGLTELDLQFLRARGIDPDTLPREADVRMEGRARGAVSVSGEIGSFDMGVLLDVVGGAFRQNQVDSARLAVTATDLPRTSGTWGVGASATGVDWQGRSFQQGGLEAQMTRRTGEGRLELARSADEQYRAVGSFRFGDAGGEVGLQTAQIQVGEDLWNLTRPATVLWDDRSVTVESVDVVREGADPMSLTAQGTLTRGGESDFRAELNGLHLDRVVHVGQLSGLEIGGHVDLDVTVTGPSESPRIDGEFRIDGPRYGAMELSRIDGSLQYADQRAVFSLRGFDGGRDAIGASGELPLDLSLADVEVRVLNRPMSVDITTDSLDAAIALSYLTNLEQVVGMVSGDVRVQGTPEEPEPEGLLTLSDAEWTIEAIGVRHSQVNGSLTLNPDRTVDVELTSTGVGYSNVEGTVFLSPFRDPPLDLTFTFDRFQAVDRLDVEGLISGDFVLGGTYRRPVATGSLTVDRGTLFVDEFQRVAGVVDLTDPLLFERGLGVDTTALVAQPLLAGLRNPFFDNLRVSIDLAVPRDTWLRSIETNVEMSGDLLVVYDRSAADLVLIGELEAVRGSHLVLGRTFEVDGGTVSFIGRPGLDPDLSIDASTRILRRQDEDLDVTAHVGGTLVAPVVTLSTEEVATSEADIVSYLIFGQASGELGSAQSGLFGGLNQNAAVSTAGQVGLTYASGALANQFGAALAQTGLLDYVSVQAVGTSGHVGNQLFGRTQLEAGRYLGRDVFVVLVFRPSRGGVVENTKFLGGARVEWELLDGYNVEGSAEERFLRSGAAGFALPALLDNNYVYGVFVFREWGY